LARYLKENKDGILEFDIESYIESNYPEIEDHLERDFDRG